MKTNTPPPLVTLFAFAIAALCSFASRTAEAAVEMKGAWPKDDKAVSFRYEGPRLGGLERLAAEAGWSLVIADKAQLASERTVSVALKDQPPSAVLEELLDEGDFVATRKGTLVRVETRDAGAATAKDEATAKDAAISTPPTASSDTDGIAGAGEEDVKVMGGHGELAKGRTTRHVTVMGGSCDIFGRVTGDVTVMGGTVVIHDGAIVEHDLTTMGGHVEIEKGAEVRGRTVTFGGSIHRDKEAKVGHATDVGVVSTSGDKHERSFVQRVGDAISNTALLFVLGVVMLAVAPKRMESLRVEVARSPMRQVGLGIVGFVGFLVAVVVLCITVVGIPVALIGVLLGVVGLYAGMVAALTVLGAALVRHKSENVYVHLAVGCGVFLLVYPLPFVGPPLTFALLFVGVGVLVSTRFAGYLPARKKAATVEVDGEGPYR